MSVEKGLVVGIRKRLRSGFELPGRNPPPGVKPIAGPSKVAKRPRYLMKADRGIEADDVGQGKFRVSYFVFSCLRYCPIVVMIAESETADDEDVVAVEVIIA